MTPWVFIPNISRALAPFIAVSCVLPTLLLLVPVRGARRRIRETKRAELAGLDAQIREARPEALAGDAAAQARVGFLTSYRAHIEAVREWPFEATAWTRFALYLLIPLGSWLASSFVERLVGAALD